jgi:hypothetical protein
MALKVDYRICHHLARPVKGDIAAALYLYKLCALGFEPFGMSKIGAVAVETKRINRPMLNQQKVFIADSFASMTALYHIAKQLALQAKDIAIWRIAKILYVNHNTWRSA